jgi:hypothetical protein
MGNAESENNQYAAKTDTGAALIYVPAYVVLFT